MNKFSNCEQQRNFDSQLQVLKIKQLSNEILKLENEKPKNKQRKPKPKTGRAGKLLQLQQKVFCIASNK